MRGRKGPRFADLFSGADVDMICFVISCSGGVVCSTFDRFLTRGEMGGCRNLNGMDGFLSDGKMLQCSFLLPVTFRVTAPVALRISCMGMASL